LGELLLFSPRRDDLAWAKKTVLPHCSTPLKLDIHPNSKPCIFFPSWTSHKHQKRKTEPKIGKTDLKYETLASLTWKMLAKVSNTQKVEHGSSRNNLAGTKRNRRKQSYQEEP